MNNFAKFALLGLSLSLGACSVLQGDKVDYKSASKAPSVSLEVPPDMTQLTRDTRYNVPGAVVSAASFQAGNTAVQNAPTALTQLGDVRIERAGSQRWLVIGRTADKLWQPIKDFWQESGFVLTLDQADLGIMETDWAENRAKLPQDFIRNSIGKLFDAIYSTGERDKFRTRLERNANGGTDVFISHRGMSEVYDSSSKDHTVWQPRAVDVELETEFLRRLMVKLGVAETQAQAVVASGVSAKATQIARVNGQAVVQLEDGFDRAWRRVGLALDRTNFTVEDRDRSKGIYFVRYVAAKADHSEAGFFSNLFSSSKADAAPQKFRVTVTAQTAGSVVAVQNFDGTPAASADAQRIVQLLADDLK